MSDRWVLCLFCIIAHKWKGHLVDGVGWYYNILQSVKGEHEDDVL